MISFSSIENMLRLWLLKINNMSMVSESNIENHGLSVRSIV